MGDSSAHHEPEDWADIVQRFGGEPAACVIIDVSGRHPGDEQVAGFVAGLLSRFSGAAMDDYTAHLWSLNELRGGHRVRGVLAAQPELGLPRVPGGRAFAATGRVSRARVA